MKTLPLVTFTATLFAAGGVVIAPAQQPSLMDRVAILKTSLAASQNTLRQYEWIQTTVVSLKGEEKSRKQERCYYGADGGLQKVEVSASPAPAEKRGLRGKIIANKKAELTDYMRQAIALVHSYVPPDPARIQGARDTGRVSIELLEPGKRGRINFRDYQKPGDNLGIDVDLVNNALLNLSVKTYLANAKDAISLNAQMASLNDGTTYAAAITLNAPAKKVQVVVSNSGYRKMGSQ